VILVTITSIASSLFLSYSVQQGLGELRVEQISIEISPGNNITATVFSQYYPIYDRPIPPVIVIHGPEESVSNLYAYNLELARRNLTVVSIEIRNLGQMISMMEESVLDQTGYQCAEVLDFIRSEYNVDSSIYGILTHSEGFQVALRMMNYTGTPTASVAIGVIGVLDTELLSLITGNFLLALGDDNYEFSTESGKNFMSTLSGISDFQIGTTYGALDTEDAYRMITSSANRVSETLDESFVKEACSWMVQGLQGESQLESTLDVNELVFKYQIYADWILNISVVVLGSVIFWLTIDILLRKYRGLRTNPQIYES